MSALLIIDGGTTNLRITLLDSVSLKILGIHKTSSGVRLTAEDGHNKRLQSALRNGIRNLLEEKGLSEKDISRCIAYGMITSNLGLLEIPHCIAPVTVSYLRDAIKTSVFSDISSFPIEFIPGVRNFSVEVNETNCHNMDMMRGEETEAVGLYRLLNLHANALFVLPGSHNKFVRMGTNGTILGCMTSISGELLDAMTHHTILSDAVSRSFCTAETYKPNMARAGAKECAEMGLGRAAFTGRILTTLGKVSASSVQSWLLGAVLAEDIKALLSFAGNQLSEIYVAGKPPLQQAFLDVLDALGLSGSHSVDPNLSAHMGVCGALTIAGLYV